MISTDRKVALGVLVALSGGALSANAQPSMDPRNLVVMVRWESFAGEGLGAGIIVSQNETGTLIATAAHNLGEIERHTGFTVEFRTAPGRPVTAARVPEEVSSHYDIGLLRVDSEDDIGVLGESASPDILNLDATSQSAEKVFVVGQGGGMPWFQNLTAVPARRVSTANLQIESMSQTQGQSGGGVFDQDWALIGMIVETMGDRARALPIEIVLEEIRYSKYGVSLAPSERSAGESARRELAARGVSWTASELADAIAAVDMSTLELFLTAEVEAGMVLEAFRRPTAVGEAAIETFFRNSKGNTKAIDWLDDVLAGSVDPNETIPREDEREEGMLIAAVESGNAATVMTLVQRGASPHAAQEVLFERPAMIHFLFPFNAVVFHDGFTQTEKREIVQAYLDRGGIIPMIEAVKDRHLSHVNAISDLLAQSSSIIGIGLETNRPVERLAPGPVCEYATRRDGFDWCGFANGLPRRIWGVSKDGIVAEWPFDFHDLELLGLMNVLDGRAYFLGLEQDAHYAVFDIVVVSRDASRWSVLRWMQPEAAMGLCRMIADDFRPDDCWRKVDMTYKANEAVMMVQNHYPFRISMDRERDE